MIKSKFRRKHTRAARKVKIERNVFVNQMKMFARQLRVSFKHIQRKEKRKWSYSLAREMIRRERVERALMKIALDTYCDIAKGEGIDVKREDFIFKIPDGGLDAIFSIDGKEIGPGKLISISKNEED